LIGRERGVRDMEEIAAVSLCKQGILLGCWGCEGERVNGEVDPLTNQTATLTSQQTPLINCPVSNMTHSVPIPIGLAALSDQI